MMGSSVLHCQQPEVNGALDDHEGIHVNQTVVSLGRNQPAHQILLEGVAA